jgi:hypothetical protein
VLIFSTSKCIFWAWYAAQLSGHVAGKEGGIQVLAGLAPPSQTLGTFADLAPSSQTPGTLAGLAPSSRTLGTLAGLAPSRTLLNLIENPLAG